MKEGSVVEYHLPEHIKEGDQLIKKVIILYSYYHTYRNGYNYYE